MGDEVQSDYTLAGCKVYEHRTESAFRAPRNIVPRTRRIACLFLMKIRR